MMTMKAPKFKTREVQVAAHLRVSLPGISHVSALNSNIFSINRAHLTDDVSLMRDLDSFMASAAFLSAAAATTTRSYECNLWLALPPSPRLRNIPTCAFGSRRHGRHFGLKRAALPSRISTEIDGCFESFSGHKFGLSIWVYTAFKKLTPQ